MHSVSITYIKVVEVWPCALLFWQPAPKFFCFFNATFSAWLAAFFSEKSALIGTASLLKLWAPKRQFYSLACLCSGMEWSVMSSVVVAVVVTDHWVPLGTVSMAAALKGSSGRDLEGECVQGKVFYPKNSSSCPVQSISITDYKMLFSRALKTLYSAYGTVLLFAFFGGGIIYYWVFHSFKMTIQYLWK